MLLIVGSLSRSIYSWSDLFHTNTALQSKRRWDCQPIKSTDTCLQTKTISLTFRLRKHSWLKMQLYYITNIYVRPDLKCWTLNSYLYQRAWQVGCIWIEHKLNFHGQTIPYTVLNVNTTSKCKQIKFVPKLYKKQTLPLPFDKNLHNL